MPSDPSKLASLMSDAIASASQAYADGGSLAAFEKEMSAIVTRGHAAAWLAGTSERLRIPLDSPLLSQARLSKAERADIKALVTTQLEYLKGFTGEAGDMSDAAVAARAGLYAGATRASFYKSAIDVELPCHPGGCPDCYSNCRCDLEVRDDGVYWQCAADDKSCGGCVSRGNEWQPYKEDGAGDKPETAPDAAAQEERPAADGATPTGEGVPVQARTVDEADEHLRSTNSITDLDSDQETALHYYQSAGHETVNGVLRGTIDNQRKRDAADRTVEALDGVMDDARLTDNVLVHRAMMIEDEAGHEMLARMQPGATLREPGYLSTSIDPGSIERFGGWTEGPFYPGTTPVRMQIVVREGTQAIYVPAVRPLSGANEEKELLINRGAVYRVIDRRDIDGRVELDVEVLGNENE